MVFALALASSLVLAALLASMVTAPLRRMARATQNMSRGDLSTRVPGSRLEELEALAHSFNDMAARLKTSFDDLVGEVETRKRRERELEESGRQLRASEDRVQLAIDAAALGVWDWDVQRDRLVWDDSLYRLYGIEPGGRSPAPTRPGSDVSCRRTKPTRPPTSKSPCEGRRVPIRLPDPTRRWHSPHHPRYRAGHLRCRRPGRAHGRREPRRDEPDHRGTGARAARARIARATRSTSKRWWRAARRNCAPPRKPPKAPTAPRARSWPTCRTRSARR